MLFRSILSIGGFTVLASVIFWYAIGAVTGGIRVTPEEELEGLDIGEHGMEAYHGFLKESEMGATAAVTGNVPSGGSELI